MCVYIVHTFNVHLKAYIHIEVHKGSNTTHMWLNIVDGILRRIWHTNNRITNRSIITWEMDVSCYEGYYIILCVLTQKSKLPYTHTHIPNHSGIICVHRLYRNKLFVTQTKNKKFIY